MYIYALIKFRDKPQPVINWESHNQWLETRALPKNYYEAIEELQVILVYSQICIKFTIIWIYSHRCPTLPLIISASNIWPNPNIVSTTIATTTIRLPSNNQLWRTKLHQTWSNSVRPFLGQPKRRRRPTNVHSRCPANSIASSPSAWPSSAPHRNHRASSTRAATMRPSCSPCRRQPVSIRPVHAPKS